jgi:isopentenyl phosphate kinase
MSEPKAEYLRLLGNSGISPQSPRLFEVALNRADAIIVVALLQRDLIPILGGDVYFRKLQVLNLLMLIGIAI